MRTIRLVAVLLTFLITALLPAARAGAQPPSKLTEHITDSSGALTGSGRATVSAAIDRLSRDRHIQLWVVYVDNFSKYRPDNWADRTRSASGMGDRDALLAVATNTKLYAFTVPPTVQGVTEAELNSLRSNKIEPAVNARDWLGAAVAAADGLDKSANSTKPMWLWLAIGVLAVVVVVVAVLLALYLARRRRRRRVARRAEAGVGQASIDEGTHSVPEALSTADQRLRQISDYVARHSDSIGAQANARFEDAKRHLAAAHGRQTTNDAEAIAYANRASTLAAQAQTLANADVLAGHGSIRRRGNASPR